MKIHDEMALRITMEGMRVCCSLRSFLEENEFTKTEEKEIRRCLKEGKAYHGGGGAFAYFKVEAFPND